MIYHYTSIDSFIGMIENARKSNDKKHLVFWTSSIFSMNDPLEYGINLINEISNTAVQRKNSKNF